MVTVAGLLIMAQIAVAGGVFRDAASAIDRSAAPLWAGPAGANTLLESNGLDAGRASALWIIPELVGLEPFASRYGDLSARPPPGEGLAGVGEAWPAPPERFAMVILVDTGPDATLYARHLPQEMRARLAEPDTIIIGREDAAVLGVVVGDRVWLNGRPMRVVGTLPGMQGLGISTALIGAANATAEDIPAFWLIALAPGTTPERIAEIARDPALTGPLSVRPAAELTEATIRQFVLTSGVGTIFLYIAGFALVVAAMVVSQVMRAAVLAAVREYAALGAFGIGFGRLATLVLLQGGLVALASILVMAAATVGLLAVFGWASIPYALPLWLAGVAVAAMCLVLAGSTLLAIRHLRHADPASLLR